MSFVLSEFQGGERFHQGGAPLNEALSGWGYGLPDIPFFVTRNCLSAGRKGLRLEGSPEDLHKCVQC